MARSGSSHWTKTQTKQRYRFGWFSMKLKLVGGDSAGVVTAYYMCSENGAGPERDELDFEFLGNRTGQPYLIQTNVFKNGTGGREMRHMLWFDPTEEFHTYSILWNNHQIVFFVDEVAIRVFKNNGEANNFFPNEKPMYLFSSIWNADEWATRGGLEKTDWSVGPFVSSYKAFTVDACLWEDPYPSCVSTTTTNWWDQYDAWHLSDHQKLDYAWAPPAGHEEDDDDTFVCNTIDADFDDIAKDEAMLSIPGWDNWTRHTNIRMLFGCPENHCKGHYPSNPPGFV
ncbi:putative xyloglucan endotransglucosylase/hydrolase protein 8 [Senna tora]|uniref:Putative xyloglucan endotransglucosylase/hydrolase protein 8 n=1 Tax=Senna tora TaxID=362788 RepID=A0A834SW33_9FABA|nr:putative xyloglucan endotransglucosylase/hydrolase protein 8 [Senna tora]